MHQNVSTSEQSREPTTTTTTTTTTTWITTIPRCRFRREATNSSDRLPTLLLKMKMLNSCYPPDSRTTKRKETPPPNHPSDLKAIFWTTSTDIAKVSLLIYYLTCSLRRGENRGKSRANWYPPACHTGAWEMSRSTVCPEVELIHPSEGTFWPISDQWCMGENPHPVHLGTLLPHSCKTPNSPDGPPLRGIHWRKRGYFSISGPGDGDFFPNLSILGTLCVRLRNGDGIKHNNSNSDLK